LVLGQPLKQTLNAIEVPIMDRETPIVISPLFRALGFVIVAFSFLACIYSYVDTNYIVQDLLAGFIFSFFIIGIPCFIGHIPTSFIKHAPEFIVREGANKFLI
jgi:hypothetical protein